MNDVAEKSATEPKPWTIKNVPWEVRNAAISRADQSRETIGEWITRAIQSQVQEEVKGSRALTVTALPAAQDVVLSHVNEARANQQNPLHAAAKVVDLDALERLADISYKVSDDARPIDQVARRRIQALVRVSLSSLRRAVSGREPLPPVA